MSRHATSPYRYDRATIRYVLEHEGLDAARARWPRNAVDPIARVLGLTKPYNNRRHDLSPEQVAQLGTKPDQVLAGEWGASNATVGSLRKKLGIPPVARTWRQHARLAALAALTDAELSTPICELAARVRIAPSYLRAERRRRGLRVTHQGASRRADVTQHRLVAIQALRHAFPAITLQEIGTALGVTRECIRLLESVAAIERGDLHIGQSAGSAQPLPVHSLAEGFAGGSR